MFQIIIIMALSYMLQIRKLCGVGGERACVQYFTPCSCDSFVFNFLCVSDLCSVQEFNRKLIKFIPNRFSSEIIIIVNKTIVYSFSDSTTVYTCILGSWLY